MAFAAEPSGGAGEDTPSPQAGAVAADDGQPRALPPSDPNAKIPSIKLGETIRFEEWGPIILNSDGTTRRIANWDSLTEQEQQVTWRRISKRNEERRKALLEQMTNEEQSQEEKQSDAGKEQEL